MLGIEPSLHAPEARVLPVYYSPQTDKKSALHLPYQTLTRNKSYSAAVSGVPRQQPTTNESQPNLRIGPRTA